MSKRIFTDEHRRKLSESHKGNKGHWSGKKFTEEHKQKLKISHKGLNNSPSTQFKKGMIPWNKELKGYGEGEKNGMWKGDTVGYYALHAWVNRRLGKPSKCTQCNSTTNIQWANISHEYKRTLDDWIQLCVPCHRLFDKDFVGSKEIFISLKSLAVKS